jgi:hypothetical protein
MGTPAASTAKDQSMASNRTSFRAALGFVAGLVATLVVGVAQAASTYAFITGPAPSGGADPVAAEFKSFLDGRGYTTDLISMADVASTDFSAYRKVLIGDNTGYLDVWGTATLASYVNSYGKPIVGIGEGGYAFFGRSTSNLGWPNGWHGPQDTWVVTDPLHPVFKLPNGIALGAGNTLNVLTAPSNEVGIYAPSFPAGFEGLGRESLSTDHYGLALQNDTDFLWGFSAAPSQFTEVGKDLFINVVAYPTPIPAAVWLFGSGLLGLIGIIRKKAA